MTVSSSLDSSSSPEFTSQEIETLYFNSAREGSLPLLEEFIAAGMNINHQNEKGYTPLILTTYNNHHDATAFLLKSGANPDLRDKTGATALMGVAFKDHVEMANLLIKAGASVDIPNNLGRTPLMFAILFNRNDMTEILLKAGANPLHADGEGFTPLKLAEQQGNKHLIYLLENYQNI